MIIAGGKRKTADGKRDILIPGANHSFQSINWAM